MAEASKRLVGVKRVSLEGLAEGWGSECYALYMPATYQDNLALQDLDPTTMSQKQQVEYQLELVRRKFVSGKIQAYNLDTGELELADMTADDAVATVGIADAIYGAIIGFELDPKDIRKEAVASALQATYETPTETISSGDSPTA